jgi:hypothetical protein
MMHITKGLVIDEPWIGYILAGRKDWEMRSSATSFVSWFGLIREGSGLVVGIARLTGVETPKSPDELVASIERHRIPEAMIWDGTIAKWHTPWVLADAQPLRRSVPYKHPYGAVTWVQLSPDVTTAIAAQDGEFPKEIPPALAASSPRQVSHRPVAANRQAMRAIVPEASVQMSKIHGENKITDGNLKNNHFYMRSFIQKFPDDLIGSSNRSLAARKNCLVDGGGPRAEETDIDGKKQFFRSRAWIKHFFAANGAKAGDRVRVEETAPYRHRITLVRQ